MVGLARLVEDGPQNARLVLFRIDPEWYHTKVPENLIRTIQNFCSKNGYLNVVLTSHVVPTWMLSLLNHAGFRLLKKSKGEMVLVTSPAGNRCPKRSERTEGTVNKGLKKQWAWNDRHHETNGKRRKDSQRGKTGEKTSASGKDPESYRVSVGTRCHEAAASPPSFSGGGEAGGGASD